MGFINILFTTAVIGAVRAEQCSHTFLSDLAPSEIVNMGRSAYDGAYDDNGVVNGVTGVTLKTWTSLEMGDGNVYNRFVLLHPPAHNTGHVAGYVTYHLNQKYQQFTGVVGLDRSTECALGESNNRDGFFFVFYVDNVLKLTTNNQTVTSDYQNVAIDVRGGDILKIYVHSRGNYWCDHAVIANALLICNQSNHQQVTDDVAGDPTFLSELVPSEIVNMGRSVYDGGAYDDNAGTNWTSMKMGDGNEYSQWVLLHPPAHNTGHVFGYVTYDLNNKYQQFTGVVGLEVSTGCRDYYNSAEKKDGFFFRFYVDNVLKLITNNQTVGSDYQNVAINVTGGNILKIDSHSRKGFNCDHAVIANPLLICNDCNQSNQSNHSNVVADGEWSTTIAATANPDKAASDDIAIAFVFVGSVIVSFSIGST